MKELQREYTLLFNGITDAVEELNVLGKKLQALQQKTEQLYMEHETKIELAG